MVEAARKYRRVVQAGTMQRSDGSAARLLQNVSRPHTGPAAVENRLAMTVLLTQRV